MTQGDTGWALRSLPEQIILWFHDSLALDFGMCVLFHRVLRVLCAQIRVPVAPCTCSSAEWVSHTCSECLSLSPVTDQWVPTPCPGQGQVISVLYESLGRNKMKSLVWSHQSAALPWTKSSSSPLPAAPCSSAGLGEPLRLSGKAVKKETLIGLFACHG